MYYIIYRLATTCWDSLAGNENECHMYGCFTSPFSLPYYYVYWPRIFAMELWRISKEIRGIYSEFKLMLPKAQFDLQSIFHDISLELSGDSCQQTSFSCPPFSIYTCHATEYLPLCPMPSSVAFLPHKPMHSLIAYLPHNLLAHDATDTLPPE